MALAVLSFVGAPPAKAGPAGTAFTYQGHLRQFGSFVHGDADLRFTLYDAAGAGLQVGPVNSVAAVSVNRGVFTVELDFGAGAFDGDERWLEIEVRHPAGGGGYTLLTPRVELLAVPYAQVALEGSAALATHAAEPDAHHTKTTNASELTTGTLPDARLSANVSLLGASIDQADLSFDTATQSELDTHAAGASVHHTRYANAEATAAVAAANSYVLNTGDTVFGQLFVTRNSPGSALVVNGGTTASATTSYGIIGYGDGIGTKYAGWFDAGSSSDAGVAYGISGQAFSSNADQYGGSFRAGSNGAGGTAYGVEAEAYGPGDKYGGRFFAGDATTGGFAFGIEGEAQGNASKYGGNFIAGSPGSPGDASGVFGGAYGTEYKTGGYFRGGNSNTSGIAYGVQGHAFSSDASMRGGYFRAGTSSTTPSAYGVDAAAYGDNNKWGGTFVAGTNTDSGLSYGIEAKALGTSTKYGAFLRAGDISNPTSGASYGVRTDAHGTGTTYGGYFTSGSTTQPGSAYGVSSFADSSTGTRYGGYFNASGTGTGTSYGAYAVGDTYDFYAAGTGIDYGTSSSARWKENVRPIADPLEKVNRLRGVRFDWDEEHGGHPGVGMIAEEVGAVLPEIVAYEENGIDAIGMDYSKLTPLLVEAVKALSEENQALQRQLAELAERVERVERVAGSGI
jgi:hypothetical protein